MDKNNDINISSSINNNQISWRCKICRELPKYAAFYLQQREKEKDILHNEKQQRTDMIIAKYYYSLLHLLDDIHEDLQCPNPDYDESEKNEKCLTSECFDFYRGVYNSYADILTSEMMLSKCNIMCDICAVLPYTIFADLNMVANNMHIDELWATQKLELEKIITEYYLSKFSSCPKLDQCPNIIDRIELIRSFQILEDYLKTKNHAKLCANVSNWNQCGAIDKIFCSRVKLTLRDFAEVRDILPKELEGKKLIYLDFGMYQLYEDNLFSCTDMDAYSNMYQNQFIYSPTHMEEVCRMNDDSCEKIRRETISKVCNNFEILPTSESLEFRFEPVESCYARAKKHLQMNQQAEALECAAFETLEERTMDLAGWDIEKMIKLKKEISNLSIEEILDSNNKTIDNTILHKISFFICKTTVLPESLKNYGSKNRSFYEIRSAIRQLYMLMNALGYHKNKVERRTKFTIGALYPNYDPKFYRTVRSGFYDMDHITYASNCDYFVTCDKTLSLQAFEIFRYLGVSTYVLYYNKNTSTIELV